jgi:uncharacterized membrane protein
MLDAQGYIADHPRRVMNRRRARSTVHLHVVERGRTHMSNVDDVPVDLYIAAYDDAAAAQSDWDALKDLVKDQVITVDGLVLVSRAQDGTIDVKDDARDLGVGAVIGAVGGAIIGLIFPPSLLASALVGAGLGAGTSALLDHHHKKQIKADVEEVLPPGSSGIVALFEERWVADVEKALATADKVTKHEVDRSSAATVTQAGPEGAPASA